jgi:hypothetical protein
MSAAGRRIVFWLPRILGIAFALFIGIFALDVFSEESGFWNTAVGLIMHMIPSALVVGALVFAWKWEWIGAILFGALGLAYALTARNHPDWILLISGPLFVIALLFLMNWLRRAELRTGC